MAKDNSHPPRQFKGVTISSTFTDLKEHRAALIKIIKSNGLTDVAMENDSAKPVSVIDSSLQMVRDGSAYIGLISHKYGQTPESVDLNPDSVSITELEFNEAIDLDRPILLFVMGERHQVLRADVEPDPEKQKKLDAFRQRSKKMKGIEGPDRVYATFESLEDFKEKAAAAVAGLARSLDEKPESPHELSAASEPLVVDTEPIPKPPALYTEPPYIGSHEFVGRQAQLDTLSDWATAADSHPVLLFEAIGGAGKSMLTWEWINNHSTGVRADWAGRFWYSFYERGAIMSDFCARALAYITGQPLGDFRKQKTAVLAEKLLRHLQSKPYLLVLDGLERVLVSYHRIDAAQLADEDAGTTDEIAHRDPCAAIRPEDDDLLRALAGAAPSKILITSRLIPRVLLNSASQPIPGVLRERLPGLRPADAEALLRSCGVQGDSRAIQEYLQTHCDCHPLVTGVVAGLITDYFPDRGNFDAWLEALDGGGSLNLAELDLVQKRNHILKAALKKVPVEGRQLLNLLTTLFESVDAATLDLLNPFLPAGPKVISESELLLKGLRWLWSMVSGKQREQVRREYIAALHNRSAHKISSLSRDLMPEFLASQRKLANVSQDLERRGLLQYDVSTGRYDLHPVVRGVVAGGLRPDDTERNGQRIVDYFSQAAHDPYEHAETLDDLRYGLQIARTLLQMGRLQHAFHVYRDDLSDALIFNLEAYAEVLSLIRAFFPHGWAVPPKKLSENDTAFLLNNIAIALEKADEIEEAFTVHGAVLTFHLRRENWRGVAATLSNFVPMLFARRRVAKSESCLRIVLEIAALTNDPDILFWARLGLFRLLVGRGARQEADQIWQLVNSAQRPLNRRIYRKGIAERFYAEYRLEYGDLREEDLATAERLAKAGRDRSVIRALHRLRGKWWLDQCRWTQAAESLSVAVALANAGGHRDVWAETMLVIARYHLEQPLDLRQEAEQLTQTKRTPYLGLAELWLLVGDNVKAKDMAFAAYKSAWADGEPYVFRYELDKSRALLERLGVEVPDLPPYDPAKDEPLPWEADVLAAIEKLRAEKEAEKKEVEVEKKAKKANPTISKRTRRPAKPRTKE